MAVNEFATLSIIHDAPKTITKPEIEHLAIFFSLFSSRFAVRFLCVLIQWHELFVIAYRRNLPLSRIFRPFSLKRWKRGNATEPGKVALGLSSCAIFICFFLLVPNKERQEKKNERNRNDCCAFRGNAHVVTFSFVACRYIAYTFPSTNLLAPLDTQPLKPFLSSFLLLLLLRSASQCAFHDHHFSQSSFVHFGFSLSPNSSRRRANPLPLSSHTLFDYLYVSHCVHIYMCVSTHE